MLSIHGSRENTLGLGEPTVWCVICSECVVCRKQDCAACDKASAPGHSHLTELKQTADGGRAAAFADLLRSKNLQAGDPRLLLLVSTKPVSIRTCHRYYQQATKEVQATSKPDAEPAVAAAASVYVGGKAGTGKTYLMKHLQRARRERERAPSPIP